MENNLCSVKRKHFDILFNEYFRTEDITEHVEIDKEQLYSNYEIIKIHLHEPDNIDDFLYHVFEHIVTYSGQKFNELIKDDKIKYEKSVNLLTKYLPYLKKKLIEELEESTHYTEVKTKKSSYLIDEDLSSMSKQRELGEVILFFLTEGLLNAPIAMSKIRLKTSNQMPIHGSDGVHISECGSKLIYGESKLTDKFDSGKKASRESIVKFSGIKPIDYIGDEIDIIGNNFPLVDLNKREILEKIINPYFIEGIEKGKENYELTCFLGYGDDEYNLYLKNNNKTAYKNELNKKILTLLKYYRKKESELKNKKITFFMFPISNIFNLLQKYSIKIDQIQNLKNIKN